MTSPTTSSIIAALVRTTPRRVVVRPLVDKTVNVVPRLVEHRAAPAAKACTGVAPRRPCRMKEKAMGSVMPVSATAVEMARLAFRGVKEVLSPPIFSLEPKVQSDKFLDTESTFVNQQQQA